MSYHREVDNEGNNKNRWVKVCFEGVGDKGRVIVVILCSSQWTGRSVTFVKD